MKLTLLPAFSLFAVTVSGVEVENAKCKRAITTVADKNNDYCMTTCDQIIKSGGVPEENTAFTAFCVFAHYNVVNGHAVVTNDCFENTVYGYSEGSEHDSIVPNLHTSTPAECQLACQENAECWHFVWATEMVSGTSTQQRCLLKSEEMIRGALAQLTESGASIIDDRYCSLSLAEGCANGSQCLKCGETHRCAWDSSVHVSGWKSCSNRQDACLMKQYAKCKQYASIDNAKLNDECEVMCNTLMNSGGEEALSSSEEFKKTCAREHYTIGNGDNRAHPTGTCFSNIVFGYTEANNLSSMEDAQNIFADTPAQCQLICQKHAGCVAFVYVTEAIDNSHVSQTKRCLLKSQDMVSKALSMDVSQENPHIDPAYCNSEISSMCGTQYDCVSCSEGTTACAWNSVYHISGQRHCGSLKDTCELK